MAWRGSAARASPASAAGRNEGEAGATTPKRAPHNSVEETECGHAGNRLGNLAQPELDLPESGVSAKCAANPRNALSAVVFLGYHATATSRSCRIWCRNPSQGQPLPGQGRCQRLARGSPNGSSDRFRAGTAGRTRICRRDGNHLAHRADRIGGLRPDPTCAAGAAAPAPKAPPKATQQKAAPAQQKAARRASRSTAGQQAQAVSSRSSSSRPGPSSASRARKPTPSRSASPARTDESSPACRWSRRC